MCPKKGFGLGRGQSDGAFHKNWVLCCLGARDRVSSISCPEAFSPGPRAKNRGPGSRLPYSLFHAAPTQKFLKMIWFLLGVLGALRGSKENEEQVAE